MSTRRVLITGGAGNLGKYVIEELKKEWEIRVLGRREPRGSQHQFIQADISNSKEVEDTLEDTTVLATKGQEARKWVKENFSLQRMIDEHLDYFREINSDS